MSSNPFAQIPIASHPVTISNAATNTICGISSSRLGQGLAKLRGSFLVYYARCITHCWTVPLCSLCIGLISAYDSYLTIKYANSLKALELNPIGRWIMGLDQAAVDGVNHIALFLGCKFAGTVMVLFILQMMWFWRRRWSGVIALKVALFQLGLLCMLLFWPYH